MEFHARTAVLISRQIYYNNVTPDISADTVTLILQRDPATAVSFAGDVLTSGASGIVVFELTEVDTDLEPGIYQYELVWDSIAYGERVAEVGRTLVLARLDPPTP